MRDLFRAPSMLLCCTDAVMGEVGEALVVPRHDRRGSEIDRLNKDTCQDEGVSIAFSESMLTFIFLNGLDFC